MNDFGMNDCVEKSTEIKTLFSIFDVFPSHSLMRTAMCIVPLHILIYVGFLKIKQEHVVAPHMKRSYESLCMLEVVHEPAHRTFFQKFFSIPSHLFRWLFRSAPGQGMCHSGL